VGPAVPGRRVELRSKARNHHLHRAGLLGPVVESALAEFVEERPLRQQRLAYRQRLMLEGHQGRHCPAHAPRALSQEFVTDAVKVSDIHPVARADGLEPRPLARQEPAVLVGGREREAHPRLTLIEQPVVEAEGRAVVALLEFEDEDSQLVAIEQEVGGQIALAGQSSRWESELEPVAHLLGLVPPLFPLVSPSPVGLQDLADNVWRSPRQVNEEPAGKPKRTHGGSCPPRGLANRRRRETPSVRSPGVARGTPWWRG